MWWWFDVTWTGDGSQQSAALSSTLDTVGKRPTPLLTNINRGQQVTTPLATAFNLQHLKFRGFSSNLMRTIIE